MRSTVPIIWWERWVQWTKTKAARRLHEQWNSASGTLHWSKDETALFMWAMLVENSQPK